VKELAEMVTLMLLSLASPLKSVIYPLMQLIMTDVMTPAR
jgi:hypothetical protein